MELYAIRWKKHIDFYEQVDFKKCNLTALDYFLWDYVKSLFYDNKPATVETLEAKIVHDL